MSLKDGFNLGGWVVRPLQGTFEQDDSIARVQPKSMDVLLVLAGRSPNVVERDELLVAAVIEVGFERWLENADRDAANDQQASQTSEDYGLSIALLRFDNMSSDAEQEFFSDGISEELLNLLAKFPDLRVISRSSALTYKNKGIDIPTVASELRVSHVLEGSVPRSSCCSSRHGGGSVILGFFEESFHGFSEEARTRGIPSLPFDGFGFTSNDCDPSIVAG